MYALDFEYDGRHLSDYGFIVCDFNFSSGATNASIGSKITFNKVSRHYGRKHSLLSTQYDETLTSTFHICKNPDIFDTDEMEISYEEYTELVRWLNRKHYHKFMLMDEDDKYNTFCYYNVSFNIEKIKIRDILYGLSLTIFSDAPFGYGEEQKNIFKFNANQSYTISDKNNELGITFPKLRITCLSSGTLKLTNSFTGCSTEIKNCVENEIITLDGEYQTLFSNNANHAIYDDFNYDFFSIGNTLKNRLNVITSSLPCKLEISYYPIIKDSP